MEIQYLTLLRDNPERRPKHPTNKGRIQPISLDEISTLEQLYNNGHLFPKSLRELLFLAGQSCYVLDHGIWDTQQEMQEYVRRKMTTNSRTITRPFFAVDLYNGNEQFIFVYLDEGDDPNTYEGYYSFDPNEDDGDDWISPLRLTLTDLVNHGIHMAKQGLNPF